MPKSLPLISENFVRRATLPDGRDRIIHRDRKLTGFQYRLRRTSKGISKTFQVGFSAAPGHAAKW